jgi:leucyl/phenylalanyl-tRNA---protein transferase
MPVYELIQEHVFPNPEEAEADGLLAIGGDLDVRRLLIAYASGIFPWYSEGQPILWWSPDPRTVLFLNQFKRTKNLKRLVNSNHFDVRFDTNFKEVIVKCSSVPRKGQDGTWITNSMINAYSKLHEMGYCHSVETYLKNRLVGGLYGVSLGGIFFGESMFHLETDASKVALWHLVDQLLEWDFDMIDVQQDTPHLKSMGAVNLDRRKFLNLLDISLKRNSKVGVWDRIN